MIVRITVQDKAQSYTIQRFLASMPYFLRKRTKYDTAADTEAITRAERLLDRASGALTREEVDFLKKRIEKVFGDYANRIMKKEPAEKICSRLQVDIVNAFEDKDEGGHIYYWLQQTGQIICQ